MVDADDTDMTHDTSDGGCLEDATSGALRVSSTHAWKAEVRMRKVNDRLEAYEKHAQEAYGKGFVMHLMEVRYHLEQMQVEIGRELRARDND